MKKMKIKKQYSKLRQNRVQFILANLVFFYSGYFDSKAMEFT